MMYNNGARKIMIASLCAISVGGVAQAAQAQAAAESFSAMARARYEQELRVAQPLDQIVDAFAQAPFNAQNGQGGQEQSGLSYWFNKAKALTMWGSNVAQLNPKITALTQELLYVQTQLQNVIMEQQGQGLDEARAMQLRGHHNSIRGRIDQLLKQVIQLLKEEKKNSSFFVKALGGVNVLFTLAQNSAHYVLPETMQATIHEYAMKLAFMTASVRARELGSLKDLSEMVVQQCNNLVALVRINENNLPPYMARDIRLAVTDLKGLIAMHQALFDAAQDNATKASMRILLDAERAALQSAEALLEENDLLPQDEGQVHDQAVPVD